MFTSTDDHDGALLRRLKEAGGRGRASRLGFATGADGSKRRPLVIVARVATGADPASDLIALVEAGAEAVEFAAPVPAGELARLLPGARVPVGLALDLESDAQRALGPTIDGLDWIRMSGMAPARVLAGVGTTRLVDVSVGLPAGIRAGLAGLKAEALVATGPHDDGTLTIETLIALAAIQGASQRPLIAGPGLGIRPEDAGVLQQHGIEGVFITAGAPAVRAWAEAIDKL